MTNKIGPTFANELDAAGLGGAAISWMADGTYNIDGLNAAQQQMFLQVLAAHDPTKQLSPVLSYLQFRALFTAVENQAIMAAAQTNHAVLDWLLQAVGASEINLGDAQVKAGLDALAGTGLITAAREAAILANQPPPPQ
jgi:hypothetical protein